MAVRLRITARPKTGRHHPAATRPIRTTRSPAAARTPSTSSARSAATAATIPIPQLNVLSISASDTPPCARSHAKTGGRSHAPRSISAPKPVGQHPRHVLRQPATRDMREPPQSARPERRQRRPNIDPRRRQKIRSERPLPERRRRVQPEPRRLHDPPHQAVAVGMHPVRGEPEQHVALDHVPRQRPAAFHRPDRETREVEIVAGIHARHLRRLATDERGARLAAAVGDPLDQPRRVLHVEPTRRVIVEKEQRLRPLADQIVDAHRHEVDPDPAEFAAIDGHAELGAHPVRRRHEDRIGVPRGLQIEQRPEPAETRHDARPPRALGRRLDPLDKRVAGVDVHPRAGIGHSVRLVGHARSPAPVSSDPLAQRARDGNTRLTLSRGLL